MERPSLNDSQVYPDDQVLAKHLGPRKKTWDALQTLLQANHPGLTMTWKYYLDGKSWLCKLAKKSKTLCWISIWNQAFKMTFYFSAKAEPLIKTTPLLDDAMRAAWLKTHDQKFRPIILRPKSQKDLLIVSQLIQLKEKA